MMNEPNSETAKPTVGRQAVITKSSRTPTNTDTAAHTLHEYVVTSIAITCAYFLHR